MKKFYAFLAAALFSVCAFASKDVVPTDADLAAYWEPGQVCVCIYVSNDIKCADIVFVGTYNDWSDQASACKKFEPVEHFDGWYVVAVDDDGKPEDPEKEPYSDLQGKPVQLDANGEFSWDYQVGAATYVRGGAQIVEGSHKGEIDIQQYGTDAPNVYTVDEWKKDPCSAVYNSYKIVVINDGCDGFAIPYVVGSFTNNWKFQQLQIDQAKTQELGAGYYYWSFRAAAGGEFQIVSGLMDETGTVVIEPAWVDEAYLQTYSAADDEWSRINGGDNFVLGEQAEIVFDVRNDTLRWARCDETPAEKVAVFFKAPAGAPEAGVDVLGDFDNWQGTIMTWDPSTNYYEASIEAKPAHTFKFREAGDTEWKNQVEYYDAEKDEWFTFGDGHDRVLKFKELWADGNVGGEAVKVVMLDFSNPDEYRWQANEQGIENVVLTEKAQKIIVDGVLYIVRDNKMFNVQGTQVR